MKPIAVALVWHMHQPYYKDLATGEYMLPWVRMHGLKDYFGMVTLLEEFPEIHLTFNLVPSLLDQLDDYAGGQARDPHLAIGVKPADALDPDERIFALRTFFDANQRHLIDPYLRYRELYEQRGPAVAPEDLVRAARRFSDQDMRDLQVWHKLAWVDPLYQERDERIRELFKKGRGFSEDDRHVLASVELEILQRIVPAYRAALGRGQVELTTSPYYHPILPLLCDTEIYHQMHPQTRMPRYRFAHPEDADRQLATAVEAHRRRFGRAPVGLWPSEGSVSEAIVPLVAANGFRWMASDEAVLDCSLDQAARREDDAQAALYQPYDVRVGEASVAIVFRDRFLSDLIGFSYADTDPRVAAQDLCTRLRQAGERARTAEPDRQPLVSVILDGENAWETYPGGGRSFLRLLYRSLAQDSTLETVTVADYLDRAPCRRTLRRLCPGSWINRDFYIWIGHADDQRAWDELAEAHAMVEAAAGRVAPDALATAREELAIAEGSDWFWWYGDDHSSTHDTEFDDLFRRHLRQAYTVLGRTPPTELFVPNITTSAPAILYTHPTKFMTPTLDGRLTSYFEWTAAGRFTVPDHGGTMHRGRRHVRDLYFGFDLDRLFIRIDTGLAAAVLLAQGVEFSVKFLRPPSLRVSILPGATPPWPARIFQRSRAGAWDPAEPQRAEAAAAVLVEIAIPFSSLDAKPQDEIAFFVSLWRDGVDIERHPEHGTIRLSVPTESFELQNWEV